MMFKRKLDRVIDLDKTEKKTKTEEGIKLEKKDIPAMILAALIVFVPAILVVVGIFLLVIWLLFWR